LQEKKPHRNTEGKRVKGRSGLLRIKGFGHAVWPKGEMDVEVNVF
jgi:hypothetical protein